MPKRKQKKAAGKPTKGALAERLKAIEFSVQKAAEGIIWIESNGRISFVNEAILRILGYTEKALTRKTVFDIDVNVHRDDWKKRVAKLKKHGDLFMESTYSRKDGHTVQVEIAASFMTHGGKDLVCAFVRDASSRRKVEQALRESEETFRNLAEESPNMIFIHNFKRIAYANRRCAELMKCRREDFYAPSFNLLDIIAPESRKKIKANLARHARGEELPAYEYVLIDRDGQRINSVINSKLITYAGQPAILGIVTDITNLKQAEKMMNELASELQHKAQSIEEKNVALKEVLAQIESEKLHFRRRVSDNVEEYILPIIRKMYSRASAVDQNQLKILEKALEDLTSEFGVAVADNESRLTVREMEICNMIRSGLSNKEIAQTLGVSLRTIETHRSNIRKKLGITGQKTQLSAHLRSLK